MLNEFVKWVRLLLKPPDPLPDHECGYDDPLWSRYQEFEEIERTGGFIEDDEGTDDPSLEKWNNWNDHKHHCCPCKECDELDREMQKRIDNDEWLEQRSESTSSRTRDEDWERLEDALDPISNYTRDDDEYDDPSVDDYLDWTRAQSSGSPGP